MNANAKARPRKSGPLSSKQPKPLDASGEIISGRDPFDVNMVYQIVFCTGSKTTYSDQVFVGNEALEYLFSYNRHNSSDIKARAIPLARLKGGAQLFKRK